ncbi:hypothetical protein [Desulforhopalus singaporensis]|nr:hypothetical protein [Desulforhopalus singaporensis]
MGFGTAASGLLLLRIVDPDYETTVATEIGLMNLPVMILVPLSFISYTLPEFGAGKGMIVLVVMILVMLILLKSLKMWGKTAW